MKIFVTTIISAILALSLSAKETSYVYVEEGQFTKIEGANIYQGTPVSIEKEMGESVKVKVEGFIKKDEPNKIYATKNLKIILVELDGKKAKIDGDKASVALKLPKSMLESDAETVWEDRADMFYETCTLCHAAPDVPHHTMLEWDGLYGSMKEFAKPTPEQTATILRYLWVHAKDGIVKEEGH